MIELTVTKTSENPSVFTLSPSSIEIGGKDSNLIDSIHVNIPPEWQGKVIRATFNQSALYGGNIIPKFPNAGGIIELKSDVTLCSGDLVIDAVGVDGSVSPSTGCHYTVYSHPKFGGTEQDVTPSEYQQFVAETKGYSDSAQANATAADASKSAALLSEQNAKNSETASLAAQEAAESAKAAAENSATNTANAISTHNVDVNAHPALSQSVSALADYSQRKKIGLSGTGADETDYIVKLNLHWGNQVGDFSGKNVFLDHGCKRDFSDVRFFDSAGLELSYYRQSYGNYEIVYDDLRLGRFNVLHKGTIYAGFVPNQIGVVKSIDNGFSWIPVYATLNAIPLFVDSRDYIYVMDGFILKRSIDGGATFYTVLDMTAVSGRFQNYGFAEDALGNLYAGRYQTSFAATIYKSADGGTTWNVVWTGGHDYQHIHGVAVDPYTNYVYAGVDGTNHALLRSVDHGVNWTTISSEYWTDCGLMAFTPTHRFFAGGAVGIVTGNTIRMTTDDLVFVSALDTNQSIQGMKILGNKLYAMGVSFAYNLYNQIYELDLDGTNPKTIYIDDAEYEATFNGLSSAEEGLPTGSTEPHLLMGSLDSASTNYSNGRLFAGGSHYQATFYVKIPNLPADGTTIEIRCGKPMAITGSNVATFSNIVQPNLIGRWRLNEGTGLMILDSSGNERHGTLNHTPGKGSWNGYGLRRSGASYPFIVQENSNSYNFNAGDFIEVPSDATLDALTKGFTVVAWVNYIADGNIHIVVGKGAGNTGWALAKRGAKSYPVLLYGNGSANTYVGIADECPIVPHMIGFILDNSTPTKVYGIVDNIIKAPHILSYDIVATTGLPLRIGADSVGANTGLGGVSDVQIYNSVLTAKQVQQLYEDRFLATTEPRVIF